MMEMTLAAHAKINLTLDVTGRRPDGYHTVQMVMQTLALHDLVTVRRGTGQGITVADNIGGLPTGHDNLAVRAAIHFFAAAGIKNDGVHIALTKRIPVAAGLAGGSSNAAAVLRALNLLYQTGFSADDLCKIGLDLGADVPYCIRGGSMLAEGIGEILTPLAPMPACHVVLCKPPFMVSTSKVYARMQGGDLPVRPDTSGMQKALAAGDYMGVCHRLHNVMEAVTGSDCADIGVIKDMLLDDGADGAVMSGSGPSVFGLFSSEERAERVAKNLALRYPETFLTEIMQNKPYS